MGNSKILASDIAECIRLTKTLPYDSSNNSGAFSIYYRFSTNVGIKIILKWCLSYETKIYKAKKVLLKSRLWKAAQREAKFIRIAQKSGIAPKLYGVSAVKIIGLNRFDTWSGNAVCADYSYFPAIWIEHIEGMKLDVFYPTNGRLDHPNWKEREIVLRDIRRKMVKDAGLQMLDVQEDNVIIVPFDDDLLDIKEIKVIDFSPPFVSKIGKNK